MSARAFGRYFLFSLLTVSVCGINLGCASKGFNRLALLEKLGKTNPVFDSDQVREAYNKKPNLPRPFTLAFYFSPGSHEKSEPEWRWTEQDKATFDEISSHLKKRGLVSETFPLLPHLVGQSRAELRLAAAQHGADAVLVITGAAQLDRYLNGWGATYALILPTLFVKGSEVETLFIANAVMWDVKNEYLYLTAEAEATTKDRYPVAFGKRETELVNEAKTQALEKLKDQIKEGLKDKKI